MNSLLSRLTLGLSALLVAVGVLLAVGLERFPRELVENYVRSRLEHDADLLYARVHDAAVAPELSAQQAAGTVYELPLSGHYFRITHAGEVIRSRSLWDEDLPGTAEPIQAGAVRQPGPAGQSLLVYAKWFPGTAGGWLIEVAEDVSGIDAAIAAFRQSLVAGLALTILLLVLVQRWLLVRGLAPLDRAVAACRRLERGETLSIDAGGPVEVQPMLDAVNRLVQHQSRRLARVRHAAGNLSHALKTPLAVLGQTAERAAESGDATLAATLRRQLETMRGTIERELRRARLAGGGPSGAGFDARAQLAALAEGLERLHRDREIEIEIELDIVGQRFALDREDMLELFGNLIDNACKWARSRVRVVVESIKPENGSADDGFDRQGEPEALRFLIDDDGPGVADELLSRLGSAGLRVDESSPGHGIGLAIVSDIVTQYGGRITFKRSVRLGGLCVDGWLPVGPS